MKVLFKFWKDFIAWRPAYYRRRRACWHYLKNPGDILEKKELHALKEIKFVSGQKFCFADKDTALQAFDEIFISEHYKLSPKQHYQTIVDIGANAGLFSFFAHMKCPKAEIYAIEASPTTYSILKKNIDTNGLNKKIFPFQYALNKGFSKIKFFNAKVSGWASIFNQKGAAHADVVEVEGISLSLFCQRENIQSIDYLKMDIEGAEYDTILGDLDFFKIKIDEMVIEVDRHPRDSRYKFEDLLKCLRSRYASVKIGIVGSADYPLLYCRNRK